MAEGLEDNRILLGQTIMFMSLVGVLLLTLVTFLGIWAIGRVTLGP